MDGALIIFIVSVLVYMPLAAVLLYVWWKYGKGESAVSLARLVFCIGSAALFLYMITL